MHTASSKELPARTTRFASGFRPLWSRRQSRLNNWGGHERRLCVTETFYSGSLTPPIPGLPGNGWRRLIPNSLLTKSTTPRRRFDDERSPQNQTTTNNQSDNRCARIASPVRGTPVANGASGAPGNWIVVVDDVAELGIGPTVSGQPGLQPIELWPTLWSTDVPHSSRAIDSVHRST